MISAVATGPRIFFFQVFFVPVNFTLIDIIWIKLANIEVLSWVYLWPIIIDFPNRIVLALVLLMIVVNNTIILMGFMYWNIQDDYCLFKF